MIALIILALTAVAAFTGYRAARRFVREKLRYVDSAQSRWTPWMAAGLAAVVALPVAGLLPGFGAGSAILISASIGLGVARGARDIRQYERLLAPWV